MSRQNRRIWAALLAAALLLVPVGAQAEPPPGWDDLTRERQGLEENRSRTQSELDTAVAQVFNLNRTLEETQKTIADLDAKIASVADEQQKAEADLARLEAKRKQRQAQYGRRLRYYQENGTFAPLGFLLQSGSFSDFLFRIDVLSKVLEYDSTLIKELRTLKVAVQQQAKLLADKRAELDALKARQTAEAKRLQAELAEKEKVLSGLQDQRGAIEARVAELERVWNNLARPVLITFGQRLQTAALKVTDLAPDDVQFTLVPPGATVRVSEQTMNGFLQKDGGLEGLQMRFRPGQANVEGEFQGVRVQITGRFVLAGTSLLRYEPSAILLQGFPLPDSVRDDLLAQGRLDMDFGSIVGKWVVKEIRMEDGMILLRAGSK